MDSSAFGSPVAIHNVVVPREILRLNVGERIVQRVLCMSLFLEVATHSIDIELQEMNDMVELLSKRGHIMGIGVVDNSFKIRNGFESFEIVSMTSCCPRVTYSR